MSLRAATLRMAIEISHRILPKMACHGQGVCDLLGGHPADPWNARSCAGLPNRDVSFHGESWRVSGPSAGVLSTAALDPEPT
jgi:hypothetical protein